MDAKQITQMTADVFRLHQQLEAYNRLHTEEIDEIRRKLTDVQNRLALLQVGLQGDVAYLESIDDEETQGVAL